jgi:TDG/mug DNA glycosylase family protein
MGCPTARIDLESPRRLMPPLRDYLAPGLDLVVVGINPGTKSGATGRHYAGPGNHFWPLLYESGLVTEPLTYEQDERVLEWRIGLTNVVERATPSVTDLDLAELRTGAEVLRAKLIRYAPRVVAFNGKRIYEVFAGHPCAFGEQDERVGASRVFVMPSTSARTAAYQRADKLVFFRELKRLMDDVRAAEVA